MEIDCIFVSKLYSFRYKNEKGNEFDRLIELWNDVLFLHKFAKENKIKNIKAFRSGILKNVEELEDIIDAIYQDEESFSIYFEPLQLSENNIALSKQKGKHSKLRFYAIKIDDDCFVITGGAIKMSQRMQDHPDTVLELEKLAKAKEFLIDNGVFNSDSLIEFIELDL